MQASSLSLSIVFFTPLSNIRLTSVEQRITNRHRDGKEGSLQPWCRLPAPLPWLMLVFSV